MGKSTHVVHIVIINMIRLILLITFFYSYNTPRPIVQLVSIIAFCVTFIPITLKKLFDIDIPVTFEILYLMGIYGILTIGELRGFYSGLWWWSILISLTASVALGFISLSIIHMLYKRNKISESPIFAGILIFCFSVTLGIFWEIFEFILDMIIHSGLQKNLLDTMQDISMNILGALVVSIAGAFYIKRGKDYLVSTFMSGVIERTFNLRKTEEKNMVQKALEIIQRGEGENIEFKSTIRTNLYTKSFDKLMELNILKTITAFLNTNGGILLIGVDDKGEILGLEQDGFQSVDKIGLHLTNLINTSIGNNFLPFIKFEIINIEGKVIILVRCNESKRQVFLKDGNEEEFYVRNGPASIKLKGSSLVDYIKHKFRDN